MRASGGPDAVEEFFDLGLQLQAFAGQCLRRGKHPVRGFAGLVGALRRVTDIDSDVRSAARRGPHALGDILRGAALLLDGRRNRGRDVADALDGLADRCLLYTSPSPRDS